MADHPQAMAELRRLLAARAPLYAESDHTVDTSGLGIEDVARTVEGLVMRAPGLESGSRSTVRAGVDGS